MSNVSELLNNTTQGVLDSLDGCPNELFVNKIDANKWSVADVVEHIMLVEQGVVFNLKRLGASGETVEIEKPLTHDYILEKCVSRDIKVDSPKLFVPTGKFTEVQQAVDAFSDHRKEVSVFHDTHELDMKSIGFPHPIFGMLNGDNWWSFIPGHCQRHIDQIDLLKAELNA